MTPLHVGITGTRHPLTPAQENALATVLAELDATGPHILHHGCCQGADAAAHRAARKLHGWRIVGHPGWDRNGKSPWLARDILHDCDFIHPRRLYYLRNRDISIACSLLVAAPLHPEADPRSARSGTWMTVRDARACKRPVTLVWPDGTVEREPVTTSTEGSRT